MENKIMIGVIFVLCAQIVTAISQVLLKKAAGKTYSVWWRSYANPFVIIAYSLFVVTTLLNIIALRYVPLSLSAALAASAQIFVPVLSFLCLRERISKRKLSGMAIIVLGIIIFSL